MPEVRTVSPLCRLEARFLILREGLRGRCRRADLAVKQEKRPIANFELLFIFPSGRGSSTVDESKMLSWVQQASYAAQIAWCAWLVVCKIRPQRQRTANIFKIDQLNLINFLSDRTLRREALWPQCWFSVGFRIQNCSTKATGRNTVPSLNLSHCGVNTICWTE